MLCEHGYTANWDCPHCTRACTECSRETPEEELSPITGRCISCALVQMEGEVSEELANRSEPQR